MAFFSALTSKVQSWVPGCCWCFKQRSYDDLTSVAIEDIHATTKIPFAGE